MQHHVVHQAVADLRPYVHVLDGAGRQKPQGVDDVDEVVQDQRPGGLGEADPVLLHEDQIARVLQALRVPRRITAVEADRQADAALLGEPHDALGVGQVVGDRLVHVRRHPGLHEAGDDLRVRGGGRVHERRVQAGGEQPVQVGVAPVGGQAVGGGDPLQGGRRTGLEVQLDTGLRAEHRQICLLCDVAESDAADLHE
ncbi:hypothetical protein ADK47_07935 [Streptomyces rimosus subsp. rimosus]|nr:hypothetical protein ADK78_33105 [Kitasatospora aureofaciens]KOT44478.1 hypothetical protein ADK84_06480 [Streptomyces sp. NRRL WC-3701]KOT66414.1 hypothetical protein ADK44_05745 [Streptomyces rimosus subsp. rimosus]KOT66861.1 hypothetical protein ADK45_10235 [Streptomyces rimosus subsp. rimosus]KOT83292.1 hypothetical protein ADK47_07935 [Streptomyces rimosus subsp. rimosus]